MSKLNRSSLVPFLGMVILLTLIVLGNLHRAWLEPDSFSGQDEEHHLLRGLLVHDALSRPDILLFDSDVISWPTRWPPLVYFTSALTMKIFGRSQMVMAMTGTLFFIIMVLAVFGIAKFFGSPWAGLTAAVITATWPYLFRYSKYYNLDLPMAACVALSIYFLLKSKGFDKRGFSIGFGISFGLGMLSKIMFPIFLLPIALFEFWRYFAKKKKNRPWKNLIIVSAIACAIGATWYGPKLPDLFGDLFYHIVHYNSAYGILQAETGGFFLFQGINEIGIFCGIALLAAVLCIPLNKHKSLWLIYLWLWIPFLISMLAPSDIARFAMSAFPAAAVLLAVTTFQNKKPGNRIMLFLALALIVVNLNGSWVLATQSEEWLFDNKQTYKTSGVTPWNVAAELEKLLPEKERVNVCYFQDFNSLSEKLAGDHFYYMMSIKNKGIRFFMVDPYNGRKPNYEAYLECIQNADMVIFWTLDPIKTWPDSQSMLQVTSIAFAHVINDENYLSILGFSPNFTFANLPKSPPPYLNKVYQSHIGFLQGKDRKNKLYAYIPTQNEPLK